MPLGLIRERFTKNKKAILPKNKSLKRNYDVVIIGAGGHGLAIAYYLAKDWGITDVAVLDKGYLAGGNTARNTTIVRSNYLTEEGVAFYDESVNLFRNLSNEIDFNLLYSERGHLTLAHSDAAIRTSRWRAEVNKHLGVDSEVVYPEEIKKICPQLNISENVRFPILGALYHPPGAIARHDGVAWGYAKEACKYGVEIHTHTNVSGFTILNDRVTAVHTDQGEITCNSVVQAVAGMSSHVAAMAGIKLPIKSIPLQACVSEPVKPFLDTIVVSGSLHTYVSQSSRGELVMGSSSDPYPLYSTRSTLEFKEELMMHLLELFPFVGKLKLLRQWTGITDMTPDFSPVMGKTHIENYFIDAGWGTWGFKATPICGKTMAELIANKKVPKLIQPFELERFYRMEQIGERGAASVGH